MVAGEFYKRHKTIKYRFHQFSIHTNYYVNIIDFQITLFYRLCLGCFTLLVMTKFTLAKCALILICHSLIDTY